MTVKRFLLTSGIGLALFVGSLLSQETTRDSRAWTIDDILLQEYARDFDISPDGEWVVWTKSRPDKKQDTYVTDIYLTSLTDSVEIQLTRGKFSDRTPRWSPDGQWIAFVSAREKEKGTQLWLMNAKGGEPWPLTDLENGVNAFVWRDSVHILFSARENRTWYEQDRKKKKDDAIVVGDREHYWPVRLFQIDVTSKKIERLSSNTGRINEFAVSPNGRWVVTNENQDVHYSYDHRVPPKQFLYDLEEKTRKEIFTERFMHPSRFVWTRDGSGFYCSQPLASVPGDDYVSVPTLYYFNPVTRKYTRVNLNWKWKLGFGGYFPTSNGLLVPLANGTTTRLAFYQHRGAIWKRTFLQDEKAEHLSIRALGKDGKTVIFVYSTASIPDKIMAGTIDRYQITNQREIIKINSHWKNKNLAKTEIIHWKGAKGDRVDGILYYPHHYEPGKKYPLMLIIHGGPAGADMDRFGESWTRYTNLLAGKGCFSLKVNYHGSGNYGLKWVESIKGHYYEYEVPDILKGVDYVINRGLVDPERLGIMGWSNGAILTIACVIETPRFKVCAPGAGDVNWTSDYGNCAFGAGFDNAYFGGPPWENPGYYVKKSPFFKMQKVTTPTIIFFGTKDTNVPTQQGWEHYRALQQIGKAPVRFLLFPGEPHGLRKISHRRRKMEEEIAWFDKYLFQTWKKPNEALKRDSPLAWAKKKSTIARIEGYEYGVKEKGILVPEIVEFEGVKISRFEITRAQYRAFDPEYRYRPGTDNYPVNNISFEKARAYCRWLSEITGKNYGLPTEKEMNRLLKKVSGNMANENTLDYWAGYSPTPDEVRLLEPEIAELERTELLLREVGSFKPVGKEVLVFDLGGNVAEWCVDEEGKGKIRGGSAITPIDKKGNYKPPRMEYRGFRVVER